MNEDATFHDHDDSLETAWSDLGLCGSERLCRRASHNPSLDDRGPGGDDGWPFDEGDPGEPSIEIDDVAPPRRPQPKPQGILRTSARAPQRPPQPGQQQPSRPTVARVAMEDAYDRAVRGQRAAEDFPAEALSVPPSSNDTTLVASNVAARERTCSDDSAAGSVSKRTLVRLMREQVDLVKSLTNAQIAQKQELEKVKEEKRQLEQQQRQQQQQQPPQQQQQQQQQRKRQQQQPPTPEQPHTVQTARYHGSPPTSSRLNLPKYMSQDAGDVRSVSSRSFAGRYFGRRHASPPESAPASSRLNLPPHSPGGAGDERTVSSRSFASRYFTRRPRPHPDAEYFARSGRRVAFAGDEATLPNASPSAASTILPGAIVIDPAHAHRTGAFGDAPPAYAAPSRDRIEITPIPERNVVPEGAPGCLARAWWLFARLCTLGVPDCLLCCIGWSARARKGMAAEEKERARQARREARQAWREKVAIFVIMLFCSACFIGVSGVVPMFLCRETSVFTMDEIEARDRVEDWTVIFGAIYDIKAYAAVHPGGDQIRELMAKDASKVFPRRPPGYLPAVCLNPAKPISREPSCDDFDEVDHLVGLHCHASVGFKGVDRAMGEYEKGVLAHRHDWLKRDPHTEWLILYDRVYNVTKYIESMKDDLTNEIDEESDNAYLSDDLNKLLINKRGEDATAVYEALYDDDVALSCLDDLFYVGVLDLQDNMLCRALNIAMFTVMVMIAAVLGIQCICSLIYLVRLRRTITRDDTRTKIVVMVPCYNEGDKELRKTINSVIDTSYPDNNKVLLVIADGNITGKGEHMSTPATLAKILNFKISPTDKTYKCMGIGDIPENRATLYSGTYREAGKMLKYLVIVKCGTPSEKGNPRAGNRGKRDSQLLFSGLLNRFHHGRALNDLDKGIKHALDDMLIPLEEVKYLMAIDADTRVDRESISHMTYSMNKNDRILALCGETKVDNKSQSWVTMIQVFEYYTNHHMKKAFESVFGCVTCLPGCFTMYRLFSDDGRPLLSCDDVYQRYATNNITSLHDKNLYHLGEDRMLTTLLLRYFPDMKLSFVPEATCYTIVPHTFSVLLSQRRRWINSTFHNMLELMRVNTMCGICCLSMKSIVILDLVATLILPASLIYVGYIVYITFWMGEPLSLLMLIVWGIVVGVQVIVFLLRSRWDYWWWFFIFILAGVPVFYFILPLYSFWHMDDFSWGSTRQVSKETKVNDTKSRDDTIKSDRESPMGFEIVDSRAIETNEYHRGTRKSAAQKTSKVAGPYASAGSAKRDELNLKPKLRSSAPVDVDAVSAGEFSMEVSRTKFDPRKYKDAEEAKRIRNLRRGEC